MLFARNHKNQNIFCETQALPAQKGDFLAKKLMIRFSAKLKKNSKLKEKPQGFCNTIRTKKKSNKSKE